MISLLVLACMVHACVYLVFLLSLAWFSKCDSGFRFAFPFRDSHGVMEFFDLVDTGLLDDFGTR